MEFVSSVSQYRQLELTAPRWNRQGGEFVPVAFRRKDFRFRQTKSLPPYWKLYLLVETMNNVDFIQKWLVAGIA